MFPLIKHFICIVICLQIVLAELVFPEPQAVDKKKSNLAVSEKLFMLKRILLA